MPDSGTLPFLRVSPTGLMFVLKLRGKNMEYALVTGASGDIGQAIAHSLAKKGINLYLQFNNNEDAINEFILSISDLPISVVKIKVDFTKEDSVKKLCESINEIDYIILNHGSSNTKMINDVSDLEIQNMVYSQLNANYQIARELSPKLVSKRSGSIVLITSIWGEVGASCEVLYSMIKGGQNTFVKALARELSLSNVRVNAVAPGIIDTKMISEYEEDEIMEIVKEIPLGRIGNPSDVANAVKFLVSDESGYVTGQVFNVNGGWYLK